MHNKNCCMESQLLSGQMHRECCYYCEVSMNNIKALPGCFRGSHQLGQTLEKRALLGVGLLDIQCITDLSG